MTSALPRDPLGGLRAHQRSVFHVRSRRVVAAARGLAEHYETKVEVFKGHRET